jgi:acetyltransferase-like isoleucine patch superfamily enzyme
MPVKIGTRTLIGPNVSLFAASHPLDGAIRDGMNGPELGLPITIGTDCWIGGNVIILGGLTIGEGAVIGSGSVVTRDVKPWTIVAGNPARYLRDVPRQSAKSEGETTLKAESGVEQPMAKMAEAEEKKML